MIRRIEVVEDQNAQNPKFFFRSADSLLDPLSAPNLAKFRKDIQSRYQSGKPLLTCARCKQPVHVSLEGSRPSDERDGRDAFFAHYPDAAQLCEWHTRARNLDAIDGEHLDKASEGPLHRWLTETLKCMLTYDPEFHDVQLRPVISRPPNWRRPDVVAEFQGRLTVFDFQLGTTGLSVIVEREQFYATHGIRYAWVTADNDHWRLAQQSLQDIYWNNENQIFAIDQNVARMTRINRMLYLNVWIVVPKLNKSGLDAVWERRLAPRTSIDWNTSSGRPRFPTPTFEIAADKLVKDRFRRPTAQLLKALRQSNGGADAGNAWDEIASKIGADPWNIAEADEAFKAFGVLASAAAGKKMDSSRYASHHLPAMFNNFLERYRGWTAALLEVARAYNQEQLLSRESTTKKIQRNLDEHHPDFRLQYRAMLDVVFPKSALSRLSGSPSYQYASQPASGRQPT